MNDTVDKGECIRLSFPVNAAYVSSARLTASSIANRMGFDIDEIEDIKTAVSEACTFIIKTLAVSVRGNFEISFNLQGETMRIQIVTPGHVAAPSMKSMTEMSLMMIRALVDEFELLDDKNESITLSMTKKHKATLFNLE